MNFKLTENFDNTRECVQEYLYDAITELGSASLSEYIQWFKDNTDDYDSEIEQALTDAYIEAVDYGTITDVNKTMITSELWSYIDSHEDLLEHDHVALLQQCPKHLQHELRLVLKKLDESLNEELLTEKLWVKVADNTGLSDPFYFYATNKNVLKDVNTLLPIIKNKQKGTYKQQLNQNIVKELQSNYNSSSKKYVLTIVSTKVPTSELAAMKHRIITITDRDLRREAEQAAVASTGLDPKDWLVHHKVKGEEDNTLTNIALISRNSATRLDDAVAHAVHKILENQGNPGGAITPATFSVDIKENIAGTWTLTHTVDITIR